ncbi:MAG: ABC transporter ATP-binding protein [Candidatus Dormibacteria bacterium]
MTALAVEHVQKRYGMRGPFALDDVSLHVSEGEVVSLIGPNGAGKTTLVKLVAGLLRPTAGSIGIMGRPKMDTATARLIGYAPEAPRFPPFLRGDELIYHLGRMKGLSKTSARVTSHELFCAAGLEGERKWIKRYSKGMKQRLAIAQALVCSPRLLILDEPTSDLDPIGRRWVRELIRNQRDKGTAVLLNSHLLSEVELVADRICFIRGGKIVKAGTTSELTAGGLSLEDAYVDVMTPP